jgi:hypothetical protein
MARAHGAEDAAKMEKLRRNRYDFSAGAQRGFRGRPSLYGTMAANRLALEMHILIHFFAALSRFITEIERATTFGFADGLPVSRI